MVVEDRRETRMPNLPLMTSFLMVLGVTLDGDVGGG
jgi:hypothetical protein